MPDYAEIDLSDRRRVLAGGDVHGCFHLLEGRLAELGWDPSLDALILLGDLVDRGPDSMAALDWIDKAGVHRVRGNHEDIALALVEDEWVDTEWVRACGGDWLLAKTPEDRIPIAAALNAAPIALRVRTPQGYDVGFVHADCHGDWNEIAATLSGPETRTKRHMREMCLWSRSHGDRIVELARKNEPTPSCRVSGVDHVFHGHTPFARPFTHDNRSWIDTGAYKTDVITVIDVDRWIDDADKHRLFQ